MTGRGLQYRRVLGLGLLAVLAAPPTAVRAADGDLVDYSKIPLLRWVGPGKPGTYREYVAARSKKPLRVRAVRQGWRPLRRAPLDGDPRVLVLVNSSLLPNIQAKLNRYVTDIEGLGYQVASYECTHGTAEELKAFIVGQATDLVGCVFFGDIPCAWYEVLNDYGEYGYASFPCDLFLCDLDGLWQDNETTDPMQAGVYDTHTAGTGDVAPEIFIGRVDASRITGANEADLVNDYLDKLHAYYAGALAETNYALTYTEDDWVPYSYFWTDIAHAYPSNQAIKAPNTNRDDYRDNRLPSTAYEFIQLACHSSSSGHAFTRAGWLYSTEIRAIPPQAFAYNLFCCSASRFTDNTCLGAAYIFNASTTSMTTVGSTKTGSMLAFYLFYQPLGQGKSMGQSLKEWFEALAPYSTSEIYWHYGMTVIGDPLIVPCDVDTNQAPPAPQKYTPPNEQAVTSYSVTFSWQGVTDPDGDPVTYDLVLHDDVGSEVHRWDGLTTTSQSWTLPTGNGEHYFWEVWANDDHGNSTEGEGGWYHFWTSIEQGLPDLVVESITHSPEPANVGDIVTFQVTVTNQGQAPAGPFSVGFWQDLSAAPTISDTPDDNQSVSSLAVGASTTLTFTAQAATVGAYAAWAYADRANGTSEVDESDETNNAGPMPDGDEWNVEGVCEVTVESEPAGLDVTLNGTTAQAPQQVTGAAGAPLSIPDPPSPQAGAAGVKYVFSHFEDAGGATVVPPSVMPDQDTTYTAVFTTMYQLTASVLPAQAAADGCSVSPEPAGEGDPWYGADTSVALTPHAVGDWSFYGWSGDVPGGQEEANPLSLTMDGPKSVAANFGTEPMATRSHLDLYWPSDLWLPCPECGAWDFFVTVHIEHSDDLTELGVVEHAPAGWTYVSASGPNPPDTQPAVGASGTLEFAWATPPPSPVEFTYRLSVPDGSGTQSFTGGQVLYDRGSGELQAPIPDTSADRQHHHAGDYWPPDNNPGPGNRVHDWTMDFHELLRIIQLYNVGQHHCDDSSEDGYAAGPGASECCYPHSSDYWPTDNNPGPGNRWPDGTVDFHELLRFIQFYNVGSYHEDPTTEDGFAPGGAGLGGPVALEAAPPVAGTRHVPGNEYTAGEFLEVEVRVAHDGTPLALGVRETLPAGWSFVSVSGLDAPLFRPLSGATGTVEFAWLYPPSSPVEFSYTVFVPAWEATEAVLRGEVVYRTDGAEQSEAIPDTVLEPAGRRLIATIQLEGYTGSPGAMLPFRFAFTDAAGAVLGRRDVTIYFGHGRDTEVVVLEGVPQGAVWLSCKELGHFLRRRVSIVGVGAELTAEFTGRSKLLGGDVMAPYPPPAADTFNFVDIADLWRVLLDFGRIDRPGSDINGDGVVDIQEFGYISIHLFEAGDPE